MRAILFSVACAFVLFAAACNGKLDIDGVEASYTDPPAGWEHAKRWEHNGAKVYELAGRYYREYNGRWVVYRERPKDLREERAEERREERR